MSSLSQTSAPLPAPSSSAPTSIITVLEKFATFGRQRLSRSVVEFEPISRPNADLVVSRRPALLHARRP
jgi:general secretion pathway protein D